MNFLRDTNTLLDFNNYESLVNAVEAFLVHKSHFIKGGSVENCKSGLVKMFKFQYNLYNSNNPAQNPRIKWCEED